MRNRRSAFSLIELLIVIAIISVLVAILSPSLRRARYLARLAICASNLHQVGVGVNTYCASNQGNYPYRKVSFCSNPRHTNLKYGGTDDRPMLRPFFDVNFLTCPFSPLEGRADLDTSTRTHVHSTYEMYFGSAIVRDDKDTHLLKKSDQLRYNGKRLTILAADMDWDFESIGQWQSSHPDDAGLLHFEHRDSHLPSQDTTHTMSHWYNRIHERGRTDRNFLHVSGDVRRLLGVTMYDARLMRIPAKNNSPGGSQYLYVPPN